VPAVVALGIRALPLQAAEPRSATICSSCHGEIEKQWESSSMSRSWTSPVFRAFLADARAALGDTVRTRCLSCHAPMAAVTGDLEVEGDVAQEGVTCNFCHNVSAVEVSPAPASYSWDASDPNLMRGPYADADPGNGHGAVFSATFTTGEFCASCHWYGNQAAGLVFEGTHPQWKASAAAKAGTQCQDCHMPPAPGKASMLSKMTREKVWHHLFQGAHTPGVSDSAASLKATVEEAKLKIIVTNTRGGHSLPGGGASMRAITLDVIYRDAAGAEVSRVPVQTFDTEFADASGKSPVPKWLARKVARSYEIVAGEPRTEWAEIPAGAKRAEAVLTYRFILPAYLPSLEKRQVDLSRHAPVVMARAAVALP
jgi:nitrate/TMAO reductase-like tetraheme cytochrome c subunit